MSVQVSVSTPVQPVRIVTQVEVPGQAVVAAMAQIIEYWDGNGPLGSEEAVQRWVTEYIINAVAAKFHVLALDMEWLFHDEKWALRLARRLDQDAAEMEPATRAELATWETEFATHEFPTYHDAQGREHAEF